MIWDNWSKETLLILNFRENLGTWADGIDGIDGADGADKHVIPYIYICVRKFVKSFRKKGSYLPHLPPKGGQ